MIVILFIVVMGLYNRLRRRLWRWYYWWDRDIFNNGYFFI